MLKNAYFLEKDVKTRLSVGAPPPNPRWPLAVRGYALALLLQPAITTMPSSLLALNAVYYFEKRTKFVSSNIFAPIFHFKLCSFVDRGRKVPLLRHWLRALHKRPLQSQKMTIPYVRTASTLYRLSMQTHHNFD